jgi:hypothetical protein
MDEGDNLLVKNDDNKNQDHVFPGGSVEDFR